MRVFVTDRADNHDPHADADDHHGSADGHDATDHHGILCGVAE
jgi:hypothetical protein